MYDYIFLRSAKVDMVEIETYLAEHSEIAARKFTDAILRVVALTQYYPLIHPAWRCDDYY